MEDFPPAGKSSPVLTDQHIFLTVRQDDDLLTIAMDRKTGKVLWRQAVHRDRSEQLHQLNSPASSTPAARRHERAGKDWKVIAVNALGEPLYTTPAFGDGIIYVRTDSALHAFRGGSESGDAR